MKTFEVKSVKKIQDGHQNYTICNALSKAVLVMKIILIRYY